MVRTKPSGLTLIELMISLAIIGIGVMASMASFQYISTSVQHSKSRTLSSNLGQEQIEKLKNLAYYSLLVTTSTYSDGRFNPPITYDTGNYPAQTMVEGGISYTRATRIDYVYQNGTVVSTVAWTSDDTGLKQITVYTIWQEGNQWQYKEIHNLLANPATSPLNAVLTGTVKSNAAGNPVVANALVQAIDSPQFFGYTDNTGTYRFSVSEGSYTLRASSQGYYSQTTPSYLSVNSGATGGYNFTLGRISSGTARGYVYTANHVVVSEVVASTDTNVEYVELYNPTTSAFNIGTVWPARTIDFYAFDPSDNTMPISGLQPVPLVYVSTYIASNKYYLIANTPNPIHVAGQTRYADAYYQAAYQGTHLFTIGDAGGTGIADTTPNKIDAISWDRTAPSQCPATPMEGNCYDFTASGLGLNDGMILIRMTDPGNINSSYGRAYDSDDNASNFVKFASIPAAPNSMSQGTAAPLTGTPATGAVININDPLSNTATCNDTWLTNGYCPATGCRACAFNAAGIATGTWTMEITYGSAYAQIQNVSIQASASTSVPNGSTIPTWTAVGSTITLLTDTTSFAFVSGYVYNAYGAPIDHILVTDGNGRTTYSASTGRYTLTASTGDVQITANPRGTTNNGAYVTQTITSPPLPWPLTSATLYDNQNFYLGLGGTIRGYFRNASNAALPGRVAVALNPDGSSTGRQAVSDSTGYFYLSNLSTGTYVVEPSLDPAEAASPSSSTVVLAATGTLTTISTFTVTNALSEITGQVLIAASSQPITTGVLVLASTSSLGGTSVSLPPSANGSTGILCNPCYYAVSSDANGDYSLYVRSNSSPYHVYGWYTTISGNTTTTTRTAAATGYTVSVSTGGQIITQNLSW